jgi:hypothetical protein
MLDIVEFSGRKEGAMRGDRENISWLLNTVSPRYCHCNRLFELRAIIPLFLLYKRLVPALSEQPLTFRTSLPKLTREHHETPITVH